MKKLTKAILVLFLAMGAAVAASLLLDIPGGKRFKRYCSYPDMKALMDAEKDDIYPDMKALMDAEKDDITAWG